MTKKNKLLNLKVHEVSIVDKGANKRKFLLCKKADIVPLQKDFSERLREVRERSLPWQIKEAFDYCFEDIRWSSETPEEKLKEFDGTVNQFREALISNDVLKSENQCNLETLIKAKKIELGFIHDSIISTQEDIKMDKSLVEKAIDTLRKILMGEEQPLSGVIPVSKQVGEEEEVKQEEIKKLLDEAVSKAKAENDTKIAEFEANIQKLNTEKEEAIKKAEEELQAAKKVAEDAELAKKQAEEETAKAEELKKAESYKSISIEKSEHAEKMYLLKALNPDVYEYVENVLKAADKALETAGIFKELGESEGEALSPKDELAKKAEEIQKRDNCTPEQARTKAMDENPDLVNKMIIKK